MTDGVLGGMHWIGVCRAVILVGRLRHFKESIYILDG